MFLLELLGALGQEGLDLFVLGTEGGSQVLFPGSKIIFMRIKSDLALDQLALCCRNFPGGLSLGSIGFGFLQDKSISVSGKLDLAVFDVLDLLGIPGLRLANPLQKLLLCLLHVGGTALKFFPDACYTVLVNP